MKITVVVDGTGQVIAAHVPVAAETGPTSAIPEHSSSFVAHEGQRVVEMEIPDTDAPAVPGADFLESLQQRIAK